MNLKKTFSLIGLVPFLVGCNNNSIAGTYGFQMGKVNSTHFGLYVTLTDEAYGENQEYKNMNIEFSYSFPDNGKDDESGGAISEFDEIIVYFIDPETNNVSVSGYYKLTDEYDNQGASLVKIGISFDYVINKFKQIFEDKMEKDLPEDFGTYVEDLNNNEIIQSLLYVTYKNNTLNVHVPVSYEDVYYELYWYGYDLQINLGALLSSVVDEGDEGDGDGDGDGDTSQAPFLKIVNTTKHVLGSHPKKEEVEEINKTFAEEHEGLLFTSYRDYNVVEMGLSKK